ncbi:hypothetical protein NHQ30_010267 [Ciborinia camelliae]|nr:hypothetical protein NHQ30_010267 [Ciborinia camelliae]
MVRRANFYYEVTPLSYVLTVDAKDELRLCQEEAERKGDLGKQGADRPLRMPTDRFPSDTKLEAAFEEIIARFDKSDLKVRLEELMTESCSSNKFDKIVASEGGGLARVKPGYQPSIRVQVQHAALLKIKQIWENAHDVKKTSHLSSRSSILRDRHQGRLHAWHDSSRLHTWSSNGMVQIDNSTLFVDLDTSGVELYPLVFEFARPAAILSASLVAEDYFKGITGVDDTQHRIFSFVLKHPQGDIEVPGLGISRPPFEKMSEEYEEKSANLKGLNVGVEADPKVQIRMDDPIMLGIDGSGGASHLGLRPKLYTRKHDL